jgi:hypothetical protein
MNKNIKRILLLGILAALIGGTVGFYLWNKPVAKIGTMSTDVTIPAAELLDAYEADENTANETYLNKVVEVTGSVREVMRTDGQITAILLETNNPFSGINCEFEQSPSIDDVSTGSLVTIKGICNGMLMDVVLNRCVFVE